jgi:hypothetical protein
VPEDAAFGRPPQGGPMTWSGSRETAGCGQRRTGRYGDLWGRPMSSSGRLSADMMMTMIGLVPSWSE